MSNNARLHWNFASSHISTIMRSQILRQENLGKSGLQTQDECKIFVFDLPGKNRTQLKLDRVLESICTQSEFGDGERLWSVSLICYTCEFCFKIPMFDRLLLSSRRYHQNTTRNILRTHALSHLLYHTLRTQTETKRKERFSLFGPPKVRQ